MTEDKIRLREELFEQIKALKALKRMAEAYGYDISQPASTAQELFSGLISHTLRQLKIRMVRQ